MTIRDPQKKLLKAMFRHKGKEYRRCLWPDLNCGKPAIRAHSVQNAGVLDLIASDGHVVAPTIRIDAERGPIFDLALVGRNRATTFSGLCADHDREIFAPIETAGLDMSNPEHRFLLAYRATYYELHASFAAAVLIQSGYLERLKLGLDPKDSPSPAGLLAVQRMIAAWQMWRYKFAFDKAYLSRRFDSITHDVITLEVAQPTLAASAVFAVGDRMQKGKWWRRQWQRWHHQESGADWVGVCLTVLPLSRERTIALLSYLPGDVDQAHRELQPLFTSRGERQKFVLSRLILNHCQNFALAPDFVNSWSAEKRKTIIDLFRRTVFQKEPTFEHPELNLFS